MMNNWPCRFCQSGCIRSSRASYVYYYDNPSFIIYLCGLFGCIVDQICRQYFSRV